MGGNPLYGQGNGGVSDPRGETADKTDPAEDTGRELEIHFSVSGKRGCGIIDDVGVYQAVAEHVRKVHRYTITARPE